jgi:hypothetical protein
MPSCGPGSGPAWLAFSIDDVSIRNPNRGCGCCLLVLVLPGSENKSWNLRRARASAPYWIRAYTPPFSPRGWRCHFWLRGQATTERADVQDEKETVNESLVDSRNSGWMCSTNANVQRRKMEGRNFSSLSAGPAGGSTHPAARLNHPVTHGPGCCC